MVVWTGQSTEFITFQICLRMKIRVHLTMLWSHSHVIVMKFSMWNITEDYTKRHQGLADPSSKLHSKKLALTYMVCTEVYCLDILGKQSATKTLKASLNFSRSTKLSSTRTLKLISLCGRSFSYSILETAMPLLGRKCTELHHPESIMNLVKLLYSIRIIV